VSISGDGHGVVSEGLSRFIATQFIESKFGKDVADAERDRQRSTYSTVSKRDAPLNIVSPLDDFYFPEVANKGAMVWRILAKRVGQNAFFNIVKTNMADGSLTLPELRAAFSEQKDMLDYLLDQITDMNLMIGLPRVDGAETKVALRNTGAIDATINVAAFTENGESIVTPTTIRATNLGEIIFRSPKKIVRVQVDTERLYPQIDYSDDIAPRELTDSDLLVAVKRDFDKQDYPNAEKTARLVLRDLPRFDDVRVLLARSILAQGRNAEAEREFRAVLEEKLPTSRGLAWANVGLADIASKAGQTDQARKYAEAAIFAEGEYGASFAARTLRGKLGLTSTVEPAIKAFFANFDKAAAANRKADVDALVLPGEVTKFASIVSGSTEQWQTEVRQIDRIDATQVLVEANLNIKRLNRNAESGLAVFRLAKVGTGWKLAAVDIFEVR
jgi:tetratricopeptide (TPR) repeat protein